MKKQLHSFRCAAQGVWYTIKSESHMRFHMVAAFYVLLFSLFYDFSAVEIALIILLIASVIAAELINTSIEELCNFVTGNYEPIIKAVKDAAAGAVLVLSAAAAVIGLILFLNLDVIKSIFVFFSQNIILAVLLLLSVILSVLFVRFGPQGVRSAVLRLKSKK